MKWAVTVVFSHGLAQEAKIDHHFIIGVPSTFHDMVQLMFEFVFYKL